MITEELKKRFETDRLMRMQSNVKIEELDVMVLQQEVFELEQKNCLLKKELALKEKMLKSLCSTCCGDHSCKVEKVCPCCNFKL